MNRAWKWLGLLVASCVALAGCAILFVYLSTEFLIRKSYDAIASAYSEEDFFRLMRTATPLGGRKLGLMGLVARERFAHLTDGEVRALYP